MPKKRKVKGVFKRRRPGKHSSSPPELIRPLPGRRVIESIMRQALGGLVGPKQDTPLAQAQDLIDKAFEIDDPEECEELAREALELWPDCADAYVLLAEQASSRKEKLALYENAVAAGERALGPKAFDEHVGHFWGVWETRPYMRAREGLARTLWNVGRRPEAIAHLQEMLRLNPNDNQGVRYPLAAWLLDEQRDDELEKLLSAYGNEPTASWQYNRALLAFRRHGDTPEASKRLKAAKKINKHVPGYLLDEKEIPLVLPSYYSLGSEQEAMLYASATLSGWKSTPNAQEWLRETLSRRKKRQTRSTEGVGPHPTVKQRLAQLPQTAEVWQADYRQLGARVKGRGGLARPWFIAVASPTSGFILAPELDLDAPSADQVWDYLAQAMEQPMRGDAGRPSQLQVGSDERWESITPHLREIGIKVQTGRELDMIESLLAHVTDDLTASQPPSLAQATEIAPARLALFYQAAADFYREAPWRRIGFETAIRVESAALEGRPWYAVVMGQCGMSYGLALYTDLDHLLRAWSGAASEQERMEAELLAVSFDPARDLPDTELIDIETYGFEVAGPEAYPSVYYKAAEGIETRPPHPSELELLEACLRAVPPFVAQREPTDSTKLKLSVETGSGNWDMVLAWVVE